MAWLFASWPCRGAPGGNPGRGPRECGAAANMDIWAAKAAACCGESMGGALENGEGPGGGPSGQVAPAAGHIVIKSSS